ncbi:purine-binding chemotaxis protein CheW [bacterium]|nr:MAG: purine-binding chemotaxis protein CheW [bacterium]
MAAKIAEPGTTTETHSRNEEHVVIFRLGKEYYALDIQAVQEIVRMQAITAIPGTDFWVEGITNLRGRVVPVIDLRKRCNVDISDYTPETRIVVVSSATGMVGLIVDAVSEVLRIPSEQVEVPGSVVNVSENTYLRADLNGVLPSDSSLAAFDQDGAEAAAA